MSWVEGCGYELPVDSLAWVDHPTHGIVWAEKDYYIETPAGGIDTTVWQWIAYGLGEAFGLEEVTRYWLIPEPDPELP